MERNPPPVGPRAPLDHIPPEIHCAQDYELLARRFLPPPVHAYISGGSGRDLTLEANRRAFVELGMTPRLLHELADAHTRLALPGAELQHPFLLAPVALQRLAHPQGEAETARGAAAADAALVCSTLSSVSLEEVAAHAGPVRWFQLYLQPRREDSRALLRRAEAAGYNAIVLTLDAAIQPPGLRALRAGFRMPPEVRPVNLGEAEPAPETKGVFETYARHAPRWDDLDWLLGETRLPVWVKGVLHAEDARALKARGVAGIVVSNHGGRSLDGAPASLKALPAIRAAVGEEFPLLLDSGIRSGGDAFKALARGADAVMVGRLQVYALAVSGALGVAHMLKLLREELEICMAMTGCADLPAIRRADVLTAM